MGQCVAIIILFLLHRSGAQEALRRDCRAPISSWQVPSDTEVLVSPSGSISLLPAGETAPGRWSSPRQCPRSFGVTPPETRSLSWEDNGWIVSADDRNASLQFTSFNGSWVVPEAPAVFQNQTVFFFTALTSVQSAIIQPVLQ